MRLLVIGSTGLVGKNIASEAQKLNLPVAGTSREEGIADYQLDKTNEHAVRTVLAEFEPDAVIDTAAFHEVDACETERGHAWNVNAEGTSNVAGAANEIDAHLVYLSTDYVFPGNPGEAPYEESDLVNPVNYYARTKLAGEQAAGIASQTTVLRPSVIYGLANDNFVTWVLGELESGNEVDIVDDQVSSPTYAPDLARACLDVLQNNLTGLYHSAGPEPLSRYDFTRQLTSVFGFDSELVRPISSEELGQTAERPRDGSLDSTKLYETIGWGFAEPKVAFDEMLRRKQANDD